MVLCAKCKKEKYGGHHYLCKKCWETMMDERFEAEQSGMPYRKVLAIRRKK
jgi:hypothetical protein